MDYLNDKLKKIIQTALDEILPGQDVKVELEKPAQAQHGDYATNVALAAAKKAGRKPRELAEEIQAKIKDAEGLISKIDIAGPGFLNFFINPVHWIGFLSRAASEKACYGTSQSLAGQKINIEFVSANPTGPLHIGNARGGPLGDAIASLFKACGAEVCREFYVNDIGGQIDQLGKTMLHWIGKNQGVDAIEIDFEKGQGYQGEYVKELAVRAFEKMGEAVLNLPSEQAITQLGLYGIEALQVEIRRDCQDMGIVFDSWVHEKDVLGGGATQKTLDALKEKKLTQFKDGATWFTPNDDFIKDRECVLERSDGGRPTYFANDIAYHAEKYRRGFDRLINIWGSNHHGHVPRVQAGVQALGYDPEKIETVLYQYVRVKRGEDAVKMSKRGGNFVLAREVLDEVGKDAFRFFLLSRAPESHLDFDLELAKQKSSDNPVFYVQYAHARISSIITKALGEGHSLPEAYDAAFAEVLTRPEEIGLAKLIHDYPLMVKLACDDKAPHRIIYYLLDLARAFQHYYDRARQDDHYRVIGADKQVTSAKLFLVARVKQVIANALGLLGLSVPESM